MHFGLFDAGPGYDGSMPHRPPPLAGRHFWNGPDSVSVPLRSIPPPVDNPDPAEARRRAAERAARAAAAYAAHTAARAAYTGQIPAVEIEPIPRRRRHLDTTPTPRPSRRHAAESARTATRRHGAHRREDARQAARPSESKSTVARSSMVMFLGTLASRVLGLVRSPILIGAVIGMSSPAANAFDTANKLPNLLYMIIVGGLVNAVLVPSIVRATKESEDEGVAFLNKLITLSIVFLGGVTLVLTLASPLVVEAFAGTMSHGWYRLTVAFAYWCLPQIFFYGMYTVLGQILNARENFGPYMWAPVLNNVVSVAGLLVILAIFGGAGPADKADVSQWSAIRVAMLGGFSTLGIVAQAAILVWPMHSVGIRYRPDFQWRGAGLGEAGKASWWMLLMMLTGIIPTAVVNRISVGATSRAQSSGVELADVAGGATYTNAYTIYSIPTSLVVVSIATAMFTRLARAAADGDLAKMRRDTSKTIRTISTLTFICSTGLVALAVPIARVLAFTVRPQETVTLARVVIAMSLGLVGIGAVTALDRVYYAFEDTRGAFWINLPFQVLGLLGFAACSTLPPQWTVVGVGMVMSITNTLSMFAMIWKLSGRMGGMEEARLLRVHVLLMGISAVTVCTCWLFLGFLSPVFAPISFTGAVIRLAVVGPLLVAMFLGLMKAFNMEELTILIGPARSLLRKFGIGK
mgnify:FL=1